MRKRIVYSCTVYTLNRSKIRGTKRRSISIKIDCIWIIQIQFETRNLESNGENIEWNPFAIM